MDEVMTITRRRLLAAGIGGLAAALAAPRVRAQPGGDGSFPHPRAALRRPKARYHSYR